MVEERRGEEEVSGPEWEGMKKRRGRYLCAATKLKLSSVHTRITADEDGVRELSLVSGTTQGNSFIMKHTHTHAQTHTETKAGHWGCSEGQPDEMCPQSSSLALLPKEKLLFYGSLFPLKKSFSPMLVSHAFNS